MDKSIIKELVNKKRISFSEVIDYINKRIKNLDEQSEKTTIGLYTENLTYNKFIGKNVKMKIFGDVLTDSNIFMEDNSLKEYLPRIQQSLKKSFMVFDGDERIPNLIYNSITDTRINDIALINELMKISLIDRAKNLEGEIERAKILIVNAINDKYTNYSEIKAQKLCACIELAVLLHNTFQVLGYDSQVLFGMMETNEFIGLHAYNILDFNSVKLLIDLSSPYFVDENGERKIGSPVAILNNQEYDELINGKKIQKDMANFLNSTYHSNLKPRYSTYGLKVSDADNKKITEFNYKRKSNFLNSQNKEDNNIINK